MCLSISFLSRKGMPKEGYGFKTFTVVHGHLYGDCQTEDVRRPRRRWLHEKDFRNLVSGKRNAFLFCEQNRKYRRGFHIFTEELAAKGWSSGTQEVHRVKCRDGVAWGLQTGNQVVVAQGIFIF